MCDGDANDLTAEVSKVVDDKSRESSLALDVGPAVNDRGADKLRPDDEDQGNVVYPSVDSIQEIEAEFRAIGQTHEEL